MLLFAFVALALAVGVLIGFVVGYAVALDDLPPIAGGGRSG